VPWLLGFIDKLPEMKWAEIEQFWENLKKGGSGVLGGI
jgi:hypothetical protein